MIQVDAAEPLISRAASARLRTAVVRPKLRLFCVAQAGCDAGCFHPWQDLLLPGEVEVLPLELPGRGQRLCRGPRGQQRPIRRLSDGRRPTLRPRCAARLGLNSELCTELRASTPRVVEDTAAGLRPTVRPERAAALPAERRRNRLAMHAARAAAAPGTLRVPQRVFRTQKQTSREVLWTSCSA